MIHPLLRLVATQPHLLADHAEAYAGLVGEELGKAATIWKVRVVLYVIAVFLLSVAVVLAGVALMLWGAIPPADMRSPWVLIAAPAAPIIVAVICLIVGSRKAPDTFADLKQQMTADLSMLREVSAT